MTCSPFVTTKATFFVYALDTVNQLFRAVSGEDGATAAELVVWVLQNRSRALISRRELDPPHSEL